jgi:hypothetical protein
MLETHLANYAAATSAGAKPVLQWRMFKAMNAKSMLWYLGAVVLVVMSYLFLSTSLRMVWLSSFTNADVDRLRLWFWLYAGLFVLSLCLVVVCVRRGNRAKGSGRSISPPRSP